MKSSDQINQHVDWLFDNARITSECVESCPLVSEVAGSGDKATAMALATNGNTCKLLCNEGPDTSGVRTVCTMETEMQATIRTNASSTAKVATGLGWSACH